MTVASKHGREVLKGLWIVKPHLEHMPLVKVLERLSGFSDRDGASVAPDVKAMGRRHRLNAAFHGTPWRQGALKDCDRRPYEAAA